MKPERHGVIVVDKPSGMTSARVVAAVKRALGVKKIGHAGTLDPMATGVLPLCIGEGTKIAGYLLAEDKEYEGEFLLGEETDTLDREGKVTSAMIPEAEAVARASVLVAMQALTGSIAQVPPMYSAIKKDGRRLHKLAREGVVVEREARSIRVHRFDLMSFDQRRGRFSVAVSKGTYVRSLIFDMGRSLGCGAHLTELRRTRSGAFGLEEAVTLADLQSGVCEIRLVDPVLAVSHLPQVRTPLDLVSSVGEGKRLPWQLFSESEAPSEVFALVTPEGDGLLAIAGVEEGKIRYRRVFHYALTRPRR